MRRAYINYLNQLIDFNNVTRIFIPCFVDRASLYNLLNKAKLVHNLFLLCLFLFSTRFGRLRVHYQKKISVSMRHLVFVTVCVWMTVWYAESHPHRAKTTKCRIDTVIHTE